MWDSHLVHGKSATPPWFEPTDVNSEVLQAMPNLVGLNINGGIKGSSAFYSDDESNEEDNGGNEGDHGTQLKVH